ncbi:coiled-coil domain-containing protein 97 [Stomoxys calcitrans]|uniref:coiled-coil domain-containing protein 97 n=1 Tax=Stomoxys calcitrans TaxID=35570 RepID=UPI0027E2CCD6|nr:coiled-coil domain-containing protein 97 [Stomoxys calcitrans]
MTTDTDDGKESDNHQATTTNTTNLPQEIMDILEHLSLNSKIVFKSQQRGEKELLPSEKVKLALDIYQRNPQTFLMRFGNYMEENHLNDFARLSIADSDEEMYALVKDYQRKIKTRQQDIKNRRYVALQKLIDEGEFFSEQEMMKREPELYHELIGQHLSAEEKQKRDSYDVRNTTFSGILMHSLEQKEISEIMEKAENQIECHSDDSLEKEVKVQDNAKKEDEEVPMSYRQQWGNFDNEQQACSSSRVENRRVTKDSRKKVVTSGQLITADERELLRQEFISQMHEQFLSGKADFDYTTVDDNTEFDDLKILNQDREDKYFEESDDEDYQVPDQVNQYVKPMDQSGEESEDELEVFMDHLNKHHSLQK